MAHQMLRIFTDEQLANFGISNALLVSIVGVCVVLLELALLACCIVILGKVVNKFVNKADKKSPEAQPVETAPAGPRQVKLIDTDEKTAAMIMALVSDQSGIPLDKLDFKSIKKVD